MQLQAYAKAVPLLPPKAWGLQGATRAITQHLGVCAWSMGQPQPGGVHILLQNFLFVSGITAQVFFLQRLQLCREALSLLQ